MTTTIPDHWPELRVGETVSIRATPLELAAAMKACASRHGIVFKVEPASHYWLTVVEAPTRKE